MALATYLSNRINNQNYTTAPKKLRNREATRRWN